jgi:hypothetical protein
MVIASRNRFGRPTARSFVQFARGAPERIVIGARRESDAVSSPKAAPSPRAVSETGRNKARRSVPDHGAVRVANRPRRLEVIGGQCDQRDMNGGAGARCELAKIGRHHGDAVALAANVHDTAESHRW